MEKKRKEKERKKELELRVLLSLPSSLDFLLTKGQAI